MVPPKKETTVWKWNKAQFPATLPTKLLGAWLPRKKSGIAEDLHRASGKENRMGIRTWQPAARNGHSDFGVDAILLPDGFRWHL